MPNGLWFFGQIAIQSGYLTREKLEEALDVQKNIQKIGHSEPIGEVCIKLGYLTSIQVQEILRIQKEIPSSHQTQLYGRIALENRLISSEQIEECLRIQGEKTNYAPIGHYLLEKKYISSRDHQAILKTIDRLMANKKQEGNIKIKIPGDPPVKQEVIIKIKVPGESSIDNESYGKIALQHGLITSEQMDEYKKTAPAAKLSDYLVEKKYISSRDHFFILSTIDNKRKTETATPKEFVPDEESFKPYSKEKVLKKMKDRLIQDRFPVFSHEGSSSESSFFALLSNLKPELSNLLPSYVLLKKLGQGGMAVVYKGIEKATRREVAIKLLPPAEVALEIFPQEFVYDKQRIDRFLREGNILKSLKHPNIVEFLEMGNHKGYLYYVMAYVSGLSLSEVLEEAICIEEVWALEITREIAKALSHAWESQIVHRDLKTENIMISIDGEVKVFDYGLARSMDSTLKESRLTSHDVILGTPTYMAPEQTGLMRGKDIDIRTDIYALGVTLYDMIMGCPPFYDESPIKLMVMHFKEKIPFAHHLRPSISEDTSYLIQKMMAKNPDNRFSNPQELIQAIDRILEKYIN